MTLNEAIEIFEQDTSETILNLSELKSNELACWLKELKRYRTQHTIKEFSEWLVKYKVIGETAMQELIRDFEGENKTND